MEHIKFKFEHASVNSPLIKILVNGKVYANLQIDNNDPIIVECNLDDQKHQIEIVHYGKNYIVDGNRSFELKKLLINDVDIKHEIFNFVQIPDLPPWENWHTNNNPTVWVNNLHLGHNGKIVYTDFETPSINWFKKKFVNVYMPAGMQSSNDVLDLAKKFINEKMQNGLS